jgi:hypothetical protein
MFGHPFSIPMRVIVAATIACGCALDARADFAIYTVGDDAACGYTSIQAAVDAAAAHPGEDYVWIASNRSYTGQNIVINNQDVDVEGGFTDCSDFDIDTELTTVSGAGNNGGAVFAIRGNSNVLLRNLFIRGADRSGGASGGGIDYVGNGGLTVMVSSVSFNSAGYGGGINVQSSGGPAYLTIGHGTLILNNTAYTSGGGIRLEGDAHLFALEDKTLIGYNAAPGGYGGGLEVIGPATADIGSPGYNGSPVIQFNDALYGGGIAIVGEEDGEGSATVRLFTRDPQHPVQVSGNTATNTGGGVFLQPKTTFTTSNWLYAGATLCAFDFRIDDNVAQEGSAIYSDSDTFNLGLDDFGGTIHLTTRFDACDFPQPVTALGAVPCATGTVCNTVNGNIAQTAAGEPTGGSTILVQNEGFVDIYGLRMQDNVGAQAMRMFDSLTFIQNCLLTDNTYTHELLLFQQERGNHSSEFRGCTFANNALGTTSVIRSQYELNLYNMLFAEPGVHAVNMEAESSLTVSHIVASDATGLPTQSGVVQGNAIFVNAAAREYHLTRQSLGVDFAPAGGGTDIDRHGHDIDLFDVPNVYGTRDLGAFEVQVGCSRADTIFCNGYDGP